MFTFGSDKRLSAFYLDVNQKTSKLHGKQMYELASLPRLNQVIAAQTQDLNMKPSRLETIKNMVSSFDPKTQLLPVTNFHSRKRTHTLGVQGRLYAKRSQGATAMRREERYFVFAPKMKDVDAHAEYLSITVNKAAQDGIT